MEEWKEYKLGNILQISSGFAYKGKDIGYGNNCLLGMGCVSFKEKFLKSGVRNYNGDCPEKYCVKPNDMVLATRQQSDNLPILGMPAIIPDDLKGDKIIVGANLYKVENKSDFDSQYIYWLLKSPSYVDYIRSCQTGTTVRMITKANIESYSFLAPNKKCRDRIVSILSSLDDKIEVNRRINEQLEELAQALFKSWFVDFEPFKDGEFVESELGMIPEGWRVGKYTDIVEIKGGGTPKTDIPEYWNGEIPFFTPKDVNSVYCIDTEKKITDLGLSKCSSKLYCKNTVFITARGTVGKVCMAGRNMAMNQTCYALLGKENYGQYFIYMQTINIVERMKKKANGAVFSAITTRDFDSERIIIPSVEIVNDFIQRVEPMYDSILHNQQEITHLTNLRDTLLPKLMSGEIDVNEVEI